VGGGGFTPLHAAAIRGDANIATFLALNSANIDYLDKCPANPARIARKLQNQCLERMLGSVAQGERDEFVVPDPLPRAEFRDRNMVVGDRTQAIGRLAEAVRPVVPTVSVDEKQKFGEQSRDCRSGQLEKLSVHIRLPLVWLSRGLCHYRILLMCKSGLRQVARISRWRCCRQGLLQVRQRENRHWSLVSRQLLMLFKTCISILLEIPILATRAREVHESRSLPDQLTIGLGTPFTIEFSSHTTLPSSFARESSRATCSSGGVHDNCERNQWLKKAVVCWNNRHFAVHSRRSNALALRPQNRVFEW
jgi:hypothetical protein